MKSLRNRSAGFTIIELLIVIVVIGILAGLVLNAFGNIQERARDTERQNDINAMHTALELYYTDNDAYPNVADVEDLDTVTGATSDMVLNADATVAPAGGAYTYTGTGCTVGVGTHDCTGYTLSAALEAGGTFDRDSLN